MSNEPDSVENGSQSNTMSPQQIMRARYKHQMMPPRTWKQQQAREQQLEAVNKVRNAQNKSIYSAAAAKANAEANSKTNSTNETSAPSPKPTVKFPTLSTSQSPASLTASPSRSSPATPSEPSSGQSLGSVPQSSPSSANFRPPLIRRGSSTSSVSKAAAIAAQSPSRRESVSSRLSSISSSRRSSTAGIAAETSFGVPVSPKSPSDRALPSPLESFEEASLRGSSPKPLDASIRAKKPQHQQVPSIQAQYKQSQSKQRVKQQQQQMNSQNQAMASTRKQVPGERKVQAAAAAKASATNPISVAPRIPLSSKFVSSLSQALRIQQEQRESSQKDEERDSARSTELLSPIAQNRSSIESARSISSAASGQSANSKKSQRSLQPQRSQNQKKASNSSSSSDTNYAITPNSFVELQQQQQLQQSQQMERKRFTAEENKASALRAAVAAGGRVEADMANIHIQVNEAFQNALERRHRGRIMRKYRPAASWTSPRILRPQLRRLQTSESARSVTPEPTSSSSAIGAKSAEGAFNSNPATPLSVTASNSTLSKPEDYGYFAPNNASESAVSSSPNLPEKWIGEPPPKIPMPSPKPTSLYGRLPTTMRSKPRAIRQPREPLGESQMIGSYPSAGSTGSSSGTSSFEKNSGFDFSRFSHSPLTQSPLHSEYPYNNHHNLHHYNQETQQTQQTQNKQQQQQQQQTARMPKTLRQSGARKRFNEDKPWKGHREVTQLSDRERKRYESLWAANRDLHLPFLYVPAQFQKAWDDTVAEMLPNLVRVKSNSVNNSNSNPGSNPSSPGNNAVISPSTSVPNVVSLADEGRSAETSLAGSPQNSIDINGPSTSSPTICTSHCNELNKKPVHRRVESLSLLPVRSSNSLQSTSSANSIRSVQSSLAADDDWISEFEVEPDHGERLFGASASEFDKSEDASRQGNGETPSNTDSAEIDLIEEELDNIDIPTEVKKWRDDVHGYVVSRLWRRSRLPEEILAQIWDLVDTNKDGTLERGSFVVGMWLCDQCLYGRKLPSKVPQEVWQSVGKLNLKIRVREKRSKIGYVRRLPNFFGSVVGHTMHGGRHVVKKAVQTATK